MYKRLTDKARRVFELANEEAVRHKHEYIGTEHILSGLVQEGTGVGAVVLRNLGINIERIRAQVKKLIQSFPGDVRAEKLPQTPRAKRVVEFAMQEAGKLGHDYVGSEHILLGLLDEREGIAAQVLQNLGATPDKVREEVLRVLGHDSAVEPRQPSPDLVSDPSCFHPLLHPLCELVEGLRTQKEDAIASHDFARAAELRDQMVELAAQFESLLRRLRGAPDVGDRATE